MTQVSQRAIQLAINTFKRGGPWESTCVFNDNSALVSIHPIGAPSQAREVRVTEAPNLYNSTLQTLRREAALIGRIADSPKVIKILPPRS